jgi:hypothetical protein
MLHSLSLISLLALSLAGGVSANPVEVRGPAATPAVARRFDFLGYPNIAAADRARAQTLRKKGGRKHGSRRRGGDVPVTNAAVCIHIIFPPILFWCTRGA